MEQPSECGTEDIRPAIAFFYPCSALQALKSASAEFVIRATWTFLKIWCLSSEDFLYCLNLRARALLCVCIMGFFSGY